MMHRCLNIVEVQRTIFREVYWQRKGPATLASLARTCRAFNGVALDSLWVTLDSFMCLVQCLPRDLWKMEVVDRKMTFQRPMSLRDWEIFYRYSSRIRTLGQAIHGCSLNLGDDVVFALSNPPSYGPLVPYLKTLYWEKPDKKHASLLRLLLTPCLVSLSLSSCTLRTPEVSVLTCIGTVCHSLKNLRIGPIDPFANLLDAKGEKILSEALLCLHSLESLVCPALEEAAIVHLSHLPRLAELSLELQPNFQLEKVRPFMKPPAFASVKSLSVHAHTLSTLTSFLEPMSLKPHTVSFVIEDTPTPDALRLFFIALVGACDSEILSYITLTTSSGRQLRVASQQITLSVFQSLLALPNIKLLELDAPCDVALDDNAITTLSKHWPKLTLLSINESYGWGIRSRVTHKGLITLLSHCPALSDFALSVDFSEIDVSPYEIPTERIGVSNDECSVGNFLTSKITYPITIAAFLSDVCPNLQDIRSSWVMPERFVIRMAVGVEEIKVYRERWEEVENLFPAFYAVRQQCENWAEMEEADGGA